MSNSFFSTNQFSKYKIDNENLHKMYSKVKYWWQDSFSTTYGGGSDLMCGSSTGGGANSWGIDQIWDCDHCHLLHSYVGNLDVVAGGGPNNNNSNNKSISVSTNNLSHSPKEILSSDLKVEIG